MSKNLFFDQLTKDLSLTSLKNLKLTTNNSEFVSQKIENKFLFQYGEWFLNQSIGIPYLSANNNDRDDNTKNILTKNPDLNFISSVFKAELNTMKIAGEIDEIEQFKVSYNTAERTLAVSFSVRIGQDIISSEVIL